MSALQYAGLFLCALSLVGVFGIILEAIEHYQLQRHYCRHCGSPKHPEADLCLRCTHNRLGA